MSRERIITPVQEIKRALTSKDLDEAYADGLVDLYQQVFSEPPYFEKFSDEEVKQLWEEYLVKGIVLFYQNAYQNIIGFAAAVPLSVEPEVAELSKIYGFRSDKDWYHAEVGVLPEERGRGLGTNLVTRLIEQIPSENILMRTQENNLKSLGMHKKIGFKIIPDMVQQKLNKRVDGTEKMDRRIFLVYRKNI